MEPVILIHGGAGDIPNSMVSGKLAGVAAAALTGSDALLEGKSALDAVIAAVKVMEDDPFFNAGKGSVLNLHGEVEMDAIVMDGKTLKTGKYRVIKVVLSGAPQYQSPQSVSTKILARLLYYPRPTALGGILGAVTGVKGLENPISLARLVMEKTPHVLLAGEGANRFAQEEGVLRIPAYRLVTQSAIDALEEFLQNGKAVSEIGRTFGDVGTVGAVAIDVNGNLAMATSTGGTTGKYPGRAGDTPLAGSGGYADNYKGAVSATGMGETIMRVCLSQRILTSMDQGMNANDATAEALTYMKTRVNGTGGAITLSAKGDIGVYFTTPRMAWAYRKGSQEVKSGIETPPDINRQ